MCGRQDFGADGMQTAYRRRLLIRGLHTVGAEILPTTHSSIKRNKVSSKKINHIFFV